ncbi:MAG: hypothetical protein V4772_01030, partial [Pseudomonadota bacterium]
SASCAAACVDTTATVQVGVERQTWQEFSASGQRLVRERGELPFAALGAELACDWGKVSIRGTQTQGERDYTGFSTAGVAFTTESALRNSELMLSYAYPLAQQLEPFVSAGISNSKRDIRSAGNVQGYPEEFRMFPVQLGLRWWPLASSKRLMLSAYAGMSFQPEVKVWLPGRDALLLELGHTRSAGVSAELELGSIANGQFYVGTQWSTTRIAAGKTGVVTRLGVPTGTASQPRTQLTQAQISVFWRKSL